MSRKVTTPPVLFAFLAAACASTAAMAEVPGNLKPAAGETLAMPLAARGVQIYECRATKDGYGYEWAFVAPDAELFDAKGAKVGKHYAGPHWEANDGSKVVGATKERADAPAAGAIPWLLLTTKSDGPAGSFSKVTSVQRLNTTGGVAPTSACGQSNAGEKARVPYTADYYLFARS
jgi:Protein of unknown function (DUF3455)